jgi:hypothetical protein
VGTLVDYLHLWELISEMVLQPDIEDKLIFSVAADGNYSAKATYEDFFSGSTSFAHYHRVWKTWAPPNIVSSFSSLPIADTGLLTDWSKEVWTILPNASSVTKKLRPWIIPRWPVCL